MAGQHYIVRLTAPDGYTASRSYSVASPPDDSPEIEITVERLPDGEVSTFLHDVVMPGDQLEVRDRLVGGSSGAARRLPCLSVADPGSSRSWPCFAWPAVAIATTSRVVVSARTPADLYYSDELPGPQTTIIYTRITPPQDPRPPGRLTLDDLVAPVADGATAYVCGSPGFADSATDLLMLAGVATSQIRVERFGPTG